MNFSPRLRVPSQPGSDEATVLEEPMEILEENARYRAIVENLEEQGYTVKEESAQVVKTYTPADYASVPSCIEDEVWNTATINVEAVKGDRVEHVTAIVCIDKGKVLLIKDGWFCYPLCIAGCLGGCATLCLTVAPWLCPMCGTNVATACDLICSIYCA